LDWLRGAEFTERAGQVKSSFQPQFVRVEAGTPHQELIAESNLNRRDRYEIQFAREARLRRRAVDKSRASHQRDGIPEIHSSFQSGNDLESSQEDLRRLPVSGRRRLVFVDFDRFAEPA
jgi:hypothetical protein